MEFAHALFMIHLARNMGMFARVMLLSATPAPEVRDFLDRTLKPFVIDGNVSILHPVAGVRTATHRIEINPVLIGNDVVETAVRLLLDHRADFRELRQRHKGVDYIPGVVVVNSVINAIRLEDRLVEEGFDREELLIIRGLSSRGIRQRDDRKTLEDIVRSHARLLGMEKVGEGVLSQFAKAEKGIERYLWMKIYEGLNTFRTSMPSEMVCDFAEKKRRGLEWDTAEYSVAGNEISRCPIQGA